MSKRIGKYKVGGKDQALSAIDGGVISGNITGITNLTTSGTNTLTGANDFNTLLYRKKVEALVDLGGSGGAFARGALTLADSGTHFTVPVLSGGVHTLALPAVTAANVGFTCRFTAIGTLAQIFKLQTAAGADKIINAIPDNDKADKTMYWMKRTYEELYEN